MTQQPKLSKNAQTILDQVLDGETPDQRAKILRLVVDMGINPEEEFFAIMLALKYLQTIMMESPGELKHLFSEFLSGLEIQAETGRQLVSSLASDIK